MRKAHMESGHHDSVAPPLLPSPPTSPPASPPSALGLSRKQSRIISVVPPSPDERF